MVTLLKQIRSLGSVREASEKTGISYSKAWTMIRTAEEETGAELVGRRAGRKIWRYGRSDESRNGTDPKI